MAQKVPVRAAGELTISIADLPQMALEQIKSALTFKNEDREKQARERVMGWWDLPETIALWRIERRRGGDEVICLPRGFAAQLVAGLAQMDLWVEWDDHRVSVPAADGYFRPFVLRDYQLWACTALLQAQQGIYKAPAGSGKTITGLGTMAWANQRTLVIVDKESLVEQWRLRAAKVYGMPIDVDEDGNETASFDGERSVGKIGAGVWEERDLTICLRQTLFSRIWELDATNWWSKWGGTWFDECHHLAADTLGEVCRRTLSMLLLGKSATPARTETQGLIVHALVGPIVHETPKHVLYERKVLMQPRVEVIKTGFTDVFWDTHDSWTGNDPETGENRLMCQVPGCAKTRKGQKHMHRNNYMSVQKKLTESKERNALIAERIVSERGHIHLVGSRHLKHLDAIKAACVEAGWPEDLIFMLRGEENARGESQAIVQAVERAGEGVIFSTVANEALDVPPLDRVHVVFPMRQEAATIQYVGRGERVAEGKEDSVIIDYLDDGCSIFKEQHEARTLVYRRESYLVAERELQEEASADAGVVLG
jgi:superfamily II DNA or RNA helicase